MTLSPHAALRVTCTFNVNSGVARAPAAAGLPTPGMPTWLASKYSGESAPVMTSMLLSVRHWASEPLMGRAAAGHPALQAAGTAAAAALGRQDPAAPRGICCVARKLAGLLSRLLSRPPRAFSHPSGVVAPGLERAVSNHHRAARCPARGGSAPEQQEQCRHSHPGLQTPAGGAEPCHCRHKRCGTANN